MLTIGVVVPEQLPELTNLETLVVGGNDLERKLKEQVLLCPEESHDTRIWGSFRQNATYPDGVDSGHS